MLFEINRELSVEVLIQLSEMQWYDDVQNAQSVRRTDDYLL